MKQIKTQLNKALSKDMNRKEFLTYMGGALFLATGAGAISKSLAETSGGQSLLSSNSSFGGGAYGGKSSKRNAS